jgi:hypothetical protein
MYPRMYLWVHVGADAMPATTNSETMSKRETLTKLMATDRALALVE